MFGIRRFIKQSNISGITNTLKNKSNSKIGLQNRLAVPKIPMTPMTMKYNFCSQNNNKNNKNNTTSEKTNPEYTTFGFQTVEKEIRQTLVNTVFANVSSNYDIMNDAMSLGVHRVWKNEFVNMIGMIKPNITFDSNGSSKSSPMKIIDVAGGTGDISFRMYEKAKDYAKEYYSEMPAEIKVIDINAKMLEVGEMKANELGYNKNIEFIEANAENLEFLEDNSIDLYTIAFGIRNCTNLEKVLKEARRVLKPGGRFMCLEFSHVQVPILNSIYDAYSFYVIPELGGLIANDKDSYQYLVESIRNFPEQEVFKKIIADCGFSAVNYVNFSGGICAVHSGVKL